MRHRVLVLAAVAALVSMAPAAPCRAQPGETPSGQLFEPVDLRVSMTLFDDAAPQAGSDPASAPNDLLGPASEGGVPVTDPTDDLFVELQLVGWVPMEVKGTITTFAAKTDVDASISELINHLDGLFEGGLEIGKGRWSVLFSGLYLKLGADATTTLTGIGDVDSDFDLTMGMIDLALIYNIAEWPAGDSDRIWKLDLLTGFRWTLVDVDIGLGPLPSLGPDDNWFDWIVGGRIRWELADTWNFWFRGDVGGFGIGNSSDITWALTGGVAWRFAPTWELVLGYRYLEFDWQDGGGSPEYDLRIHGPLAGLSIRF